MDLGHVLRRLVHISTPVFLVYYWLPNPLWTAGPDRMFGVVVLLLIVLNIEFWRLRKKPEIIGTRPYEMNRMSAAAWAALAFTIAFLFFPLQFTAPALIGMGWVDPLIGELRARKSKLYPRLPLVVYFAIVFVTLVILTPGGRGPTDIAQWLVAVAASLLATRLAITVENTKTKYLDDDFVMAIVPLIAIFAVYTIASWLF
jgi:dolichol kinase